jgi:site-specific recombinase XerD
VRVHTARRQYIRWLRVARDLSPHTIRAYDSDIGPFERHMGIRTHVGRIDQECAIAFCREIPGSFPKTLRFSRRGVR